MAHIDKDGALHYIHDNDYDAAAKMACTAIKLIKAGVTTIALPLGTKITVEVPVNGQPGLRHVQYLIVGDTLEEVQADA